MWKLIFVLNWIRSRPRLLYEWCRGKLSGARSLKSAAGKLVNAVGLIMAVTILYAILTMAAIGAGFVIVVQ